MSAIDIVRAWLVTKPGIVARATNDSIAVEPTDSTGFPVELLVRGPAHWTVYFAGWHEEFVSESESLSCLAFGLSEECRLRVEKRGQQR